MVLGPSLGGIEALQVLICSLRTGLAVQLTSVTLGMPDAVVEAGLADLVLPLGDVPKLLDAVVGRGGRMRLPLHTAGQRADVVGRDDVIALLDLHDELATEHSVVSSEIRNDGFPRSRADGERKFAPPSESQADYLSRRARSAGPAGVRRWVPVPAFHAFPRSGLTWITLSSTGTSLRGPKKRLPGTLERRLTSQPVPG